MFGSSRAYSRKSNAEDAATQIRKQAALAFGWREQALEDCRWKCSEVNMMPLNITDKRELEIVADALHYWVEWHEKERVTSTPYFEAADIAAAKRLHQQIGREIGPQPK